MRNLPILMTYASAVMAAKLQGILLSGAPMPTPPPQLELGVMDKDAMLGKRAVASNTCGWVSGNLANVVSCTPGVQCATNPLYNAFGCCPGSDLATCTLPTTCIDYFSVFFVSSTADAFSHLCNQPASPFCQTYTYSGGYKGFGCGITSAVFQVQTSAGGNVAGGVLSAVSLTGGAVAATGIGSAGGAAQTGSSSGSSGSSGSSSGSSNSGKSSGGLSTGAIVGIAVAAAVVALALIVVIGLLCWKRNKRNKASVIPPPQQPAASSAGPSAPSNWGQQSSVGQMSQVGSPGPHSSYMAPSHATHPNEQPGQSLASQTLGGSQVGTQSAVSQPVTHTSASALLANQQSSNNEWAFIQKPMSPAQHGAGAPENDGIKVTEILPEDAVDEARPQQPSGHVQPQQQQYGAGFVPPQAPTHSGSPIPQHPGSPIPPTSPAPPSQYPGSPPPPSQLGGPQAAGRYDDMMSTMAPTAVAPTAISHNPPRV